MSFYHFVWEELKKERLLLGNSTSSTSGSTALQVAPSTGRAVVAVLQDADIDADKATKFSNGLVKLIGSDDFLRELSVEIREPGLTESETAFVARAKATMMKLLDKHLG